MPNFDAREVAQWTGGKWCFGQPGAIAGVSTDSRTLCRGALFVALRGPLFDGHSFIGEAFARGAVGAVISENTCAMPRKDHPLLRVPDTAQALRDMAANYRRRIQVAIVAVTGSVGKTTVKEMVADVLARRLRVARTLGNWNNEIGLPLSLLAMEPETRIGVFELGMNHPGELASLCRMLQPDWGLVTTIGPVHLEFFESVEAIVAEKSTLLKSLPSGGVAVLRCDEPYFEILRAAVPCRVITLALSGAADYIASPSDAQGQMEIRERATGEACRLQAPLPGAHHAANSLYAAAVGRAHGLAWEEIRAALEEYRSPPMRWERQSVAGVTIINDAYNANPVSMAAALRTFTELPVAGGRWLVLAGMLELGPLEEQWHRDLGKSLVPGPWAGIITVGSLGAVIAREAVNAGVSAARVFPCADHGAAAEVLGRCLQPGDAVLVKASRGQHLEQVLVLWKERVAAGGI
ncbi:MAG: UDP-N-acetylmuramoyl-tripeptide--D-alanyl-D-alanine ligase [Verrucomicrobia bacterium]|nr:UDP-N-acetylmuramoyl-tripeptide--D-alanyl-D-alanine ligase [Verrucomicrobiota bacterium]